MEYIAEEDWSTKRAKLLEKRVRSVDAKEALRLQKENNFVILDVRPEAEFNEVSQILHILCNIKCESIHLANMITTQKYLLLRVINFCCLIKLVCSMSNPNYSNCGFYRLTHQEL